MASPLTEKVLNSVKTDPETGCVGMSSDAAFQLCRQNYFLKQQNQILQNQTARPETEESAQLKTGTQTQAEVILNPQQKETAEINPMILYALILVAVVIATVFITKHLTKK